MRSFSLSLSRILFISMLFSGNIDIEAREILWNILEDLGESRLFSIINVEFLFILTVHGVYLYWQCNYGYIVGRLFEEI